MGKCIGEGQFGSIYSATWHRMRNTDIKVAVKCLKETNAPDQERIDFLKEAAIMAQFKNTNVIRLLGITTDSSGQVQYMVQ